MKQRWRYAVAIVLGVAGGSSATWWQISNGFNRGSITNGAWRTSLDYGTGASDAATRATVALRGILALPSTETVYWNAAVDDQGRPLDGSCTYRISGGAIDSRWWSITLYDAAGYLIATPANISSFSGSSIAAADAAAWQLAIAPDRPAVRYWLPAPRDKQFELTLRMYNPGSAFRAAPARAAMPSIRRGQCA